jgi:hypothetical protein
LKDLYFEPEVTWGAFRQTYLVDIPLGHWEKRFVATENAKPPTFSLRKNTGKSVKRKQCDVGAANDPKKNSADTTSDSVCQEPGCKGKHKSIHHKKIMNKKQRVKQ